MDERIYLEDAIRALLEELERVAAERVSFASVRVERLELSIGVVASRSDSGRVRWAVPAERDRVEGHRVGTVQVGVTGDTGRGYQVSEVLGPDSPTQRFAKG